MVAATLLATWWAAGMEEEGVAAASAAPATIRSAARQGSGNKGNPGRAAADLQATLLAQLGRLDGRRELPPEASRNPFSATRAQPPSPPPPAAVVNAEPAPPPPPFKYQGLVLQDGKLAVFLTDGTQLLMAREGETLAGQYRVEKLTDKEIILQHLAQGERQTLNFGR
ncbi:MAG TPA: hypothetical protein VLK85_11790 [Ramlibacter sp.]|nr:hypothetical protein [Ramlibacter sp.]